MREDQHLSKGFNLNAPVCGIVALGLATDTPYTEVRDWFAKTNHVRRKRRWSGSTSHMDYIACAKHFGKELRQLEVSFRPQKSLKRFVDEDLRQSVPYLVRTGGQRGHIMFIQYGLMHDQSSWAVPVDLCRFRLRRVSAAWEIIG